MSKRIIEVIDHQNNWRSLFLKEKQKIELTLADNNLINIHHIGSTAVEGLAAKPIIDILIEVHSLATLKQKNHDMSQLGYLCKGENGIAKRVYYQKGGVERSHHIHAFETGNDLIHQHLIFRDYLIHFEQVKQQYSDIKKQAASICNNNAAFYMNFKNDFIQTHLKKAQEWSSISRSKN